MATRRASTGTVPAGTASFTLTLATHAAGDLLLAWVGGKYGATATIPAAPSGWVKIGSTTGGTVTTGTDAGDSFVAVYAKVAASSSETNPVFSAGGTAPDSWWGIAESFTPAAGKEWDDRFAFASAPQLAVNDTSATTPVTGSGTYGTQPNANRGDTIAACAAIPTDAGTGASSPGVTFSAGASGGSASVGTYVENALGADSAGISYALVGFTGASTGTTTLTVTVAGATNNYGPTLAVWLRESTTKTGSDSAAATDTSSLRYVGAGEVAAATDAAQVTLPFSGSDTAAATEGRTLAVAISRDDPATGTEGRTLGATFTRADTATATDASSLRYIGQGDLASATESAQVSLTNQQISGSDTASADDDLDTTIVATPGGETATVSDTSTRVVYGKGGDLAIGIEGANVDVTSGDIPKSGSDTAAATESSAQGPLASDAGAASDIEDSTITDSGGGDTALGRETSTRIVYRGQGETAHATDVGVVTTAPIGASDTATGTDTCTLLASPVRNDPAAAQEGYSLTAALSRAEEVGTATDDSLLAPTVVANDPATGTDAAQLLAQISGADSATGTDAAGNPQAVVSAADTANATEQTQLATDSAKSALDDAAGTETVAQLAATISRADTAAAADSATLTNSPAAADSATATETASIGDRSNPGSDAAVAAEFAQIIATLLRGDTATADDDLRRVLVAGPPVKGPGGTRGGGRTATVGATGPGRTRP